MVDNLQFAGIFKIEKERGLDYEDYDYILSFNRGKAFDFINSILNKKSKTQKSFKKDISKKLNKISLEEKKWLLDKLIGQINYQEAI